ncbi:dsRNA-specific ribonuclease [Phormidium sp. FACHB-592]|uniref:DsRNA-specific ribonuclease n=1 Tax=Stenomitos frigidus AS-A4 TaxID=2933935 RepID=A0ABV0KG50_9CYAN|nr:ribonuclease III domain-containing protein [Phormidium sp. FACHB-592]MBD2078032.1 dsRNA-specific ribonuclease [Phormidium sp. FACHB-592]
MSLEINLNYLFFDKALLERALTRRAYADEQKQRYGTLCKDQEAFCTLGDAVLKTVLADLLIDSGCKTRAEITQKKQILECQKMLGEVACAVKVNSYIQFGKGEIKQNADQNPSVLAETLEALIAAIYFDGGYEAAKRVVSRLFERLI